MEIIVNLKCKHINNVKDLPNEVWKDISAYDERSFDVDSVKLEKVIKEMKEDY